MNVILRAVVGLAGVSANPDHWRCRDIFAALLIGMLERGGA